MLDNFIKQPLLKSLFADFLRLLYMLKQLVHVAFYALVLISINSTERGKKILQPLARFGQMALSNYLLHSLICTSIFYSYGLGLFGRVRPCYGLLLAIVIFAIQIRLSAWWLNRFRQGPAEWLWRTLTYGKRQPLLRLG